MQLFDEKYRSKFPAVTAHFQLCVALPEFEGVMGQVDLCQQPLRHQGEMQPPTPWSSNRLCA